MKDNLSFNEQLRYYNKMALDYDKKNSSTETAQPKEKETKQTDVNNSQIKQKKNSSMERNTRNQKETYLEIKDENTTKQVLGKPTYEERIRQQLGFSLPSIADDTAQISPVNTIETIPISQNDDEIIPRFPDVDRESFDYPFDKPDKNDIYLQFNDDTDYNLYQQFLRQNPKEGQFRARVFTGRGAVPLEGSTVIVSRIFGDSKFVFDKIITDNSGLTPIISLPAPSENLSQTPKTSPLPYATYTVEIEADGFNKMTFRDVAIYENMLATQQAYMTPIANRPQIRITEKQPNL